MRREPQRSTTLYSSAASDCIRDRYRRQCSTLCYAEAAEGGAGEKERRRDEGTGDGAKEVARAGGGKAAGAWVIGG